MIYAVLQEAERVDGALHHGLHVFKVKLPEKLSLQIFEEKNSK